MAGSVKPITDRYHSVTPYLSIKRASEAIDFYKSAFDSTGLMRILNTDGSTGHAEIQIGESQIMSSDESPKMDFHSPADSGGAPVHVHMYVECVDRIFTQAITVGSTAIIPPWKSNSRAAAPAPW